MSYMATFDIGTTAVKAVLVDEAGRAVFSCSKDIPTIFEGDRKEQDPRVWWDAFCEISRSFVRQGFEIAGIVMSGQMQDVIPVDEQLQAVGNAILYSDGRGEEQAERIRAKLGADKLAQITGNDFNGTLSLPKICWLKEHQPEVDRRARYYLISSKDYVIAQLTGRAVGDRTACSTAGAMDIAACDWSREILEAAGVEAERMPGIHASHEQVGCVSRQAAGASGYAEGTPVFAGVGDAGATTLASGIAGKGQYNINLGTSGWIATVSGEPLQSGTGVFNLAAMPAGRVINVVPFLNAGLVHRWVSTLFAREAGRPDYAWMQGMLERSVPGSHGVMALPYLVGERFPVPDARIRGAYVGLTPESAPEDVARAMLEGVCYSIRQGMELLGEKPVSVSMIGGGGRVGVWCQMMADVLGTPIAVCGESDTLPAQAIATAAWIGLGREKDYDCFISSLQQAESVTVYRPDHETHGLYNGIFERYKRLYPVLKELA
ncbi:MAG: FGGY-family carbohydrate kinase [Aristaeellaceae bacterium]